MLTMMCTGVIQQSFDAGSYTMEIRKPFPDVYPCLPLLRVSGYIMVNDVAKTGTIPALSTGVSPRESSPHTIKHPLYTMD